MSINLSSVDLTVRDKLALRSLQQLNFLMMILQSVNDNSDNSDIVYSLFCHNFDLFDLDIIEVLRNWINAKVTELDRDLQELIASDLVSFGNLIQQFPLGNKAVNMELSIACYEASLKIYTKADLSIDWATTQHNLATAYYSRIRGDKARNLELSIACYEAALEIRTKANLPMSWAKTQNNLATAYCNRIRGDKAENLERSIVCYQSALEVFTPELFPHEWAKTQINLAEFSIENLSNYQVAIEHLQSAYENLLTNNNDTGLLAQTMFELARCFHQTGCLEQAKIYFKDSIRLYQRLEQPTQVAAATSALGNLELQMGLFDDAVRQQPSESIAPFTVEVLDLIVEAAQGTPRQLNNICEKVLRQAAMQGQPSIDLAAWQTIWPRIQASVMQEISPRLQRLLYVAYEQKGLSEDISNATLDRLEARTFTSIIPEIQQLESMDLMMRVEDERGVRFVPSRLYLPPSND